MVDLICSAEGQSFQIMTESKKNPADTKFEYMLHTFYDSDGTQANKKRHSKFSVEVETVANSIVSSTIPVSARKVDQITSGKAQEVTLSKLSSVYPESSSPSSVVMNIILSRSPQTTQVQKLEYVLTYLSGPKIELCSQRFIFDIDFNQEVRPELERFPNVWKPSEIRDLRIKFDERPKILFTGNDRNKRTVLKLTFTTGDKFTEGPKAP